MGGTGTGRLDQENDGKWEPSEALPARLRMRSQVAEAKGQGPGQPLRSNGPLLLRRPNKASPPCATKGGLGY